MGFDLSKVAQAHGATAREDLAVCNEATAKHGLRLTEQQMQGLVERRGEAALRATGRVEFGRGVLRELVLGFCDSPYLSQKNYEETIADLQDVFYRRKEDSEAGEALADDDLIAALRTVFDHEVAGSVDALADIPVEVLRAHVERDRVGDYDEKTQHEVFEEEAAHDGAEEHARDEFSRVLDDERAERPGNEYADNFYNAYNELYRLGFDDNSRIGGSSLG